MKRFFLLLVVLVAAGLVSYFLLRKKEATGPQNRESPLVISGNQGAFTISFTALLNEYFKLQQAFVEWDSTAADQHAQALMRLADSLPVKTLKADTAIVQTAANLAQSISGDCKGLAGEKSLREKRKDFNTITDELYTLVRAVRYDGATVYHMRCPMAFDDSVEAFWLSPSSEIRNPYLGKKHPNYQAKMLGCGEVVDSLQFTSRR